MRPGLPIAVKWTLGEPLSAQHGSIAYDKVLLALAGQPRRWPGLRGGFGWQVSRHGRSSSLECILSDIPQRAEMC